MLRSGAFYPMSVSPPRCPGLLAIQNSKSKRRNHEADSERKDRRKRRLRFPIHGNSMLPAPFLTN
jgi:hypothetical protein